MWDLPKSHQEEREGKSFLCVLVPISRSPLLGRGKPDIEGERGMVGKGARGNFEEGDGGKKARLGRGIISEPCKVLGGRVVHAPDVPQGQHVSDVGEGRGNSGSVFHRHTQTVEGGIEGFV